MDDGRIQFRVWWGGKEYTYNHMIDPHLLAEHMISWRAREEADLRRICGDPFAMIQLHERAGKRRRLTEYLAGLCAAMLSDVFDKIENTAT